MRQLPRLHRPEQGLRYRGAVMRREPEPWETCPLTRLIFWFLGVDLVMRLVRMMEGSEWESSKLSSPKKEFEHVQHGYMSKMRSHGV